MPGAVFDRDGNMTSFSLIVRRLAIMQLKCDKMPHPTGKRTDETKASHGWY
jgi:hypothetical protein